MAFEVRVPRLAESISEATLVQWLKPDGAAVRVDEAIATLETDKAAVELPAERAGVLRHGRKLGDVVHVGDVLATIDEGGVAAPAAITPAATAASATVSSPPASSLAPSAPARPAAEPPAPPADLTAMRPADREAGNNEAAAPLSPAVRRLVEQHGLDVARISPSGRGGRLLKEDVERFLATHPAAAFTAPAAPAPAYGSAAPPAPAAAAHSALGTAAPSPLAAIAAVTDAPLGPSHAEPPAGRPGSSPDHGWAMDEFERAVPMSRIRLRIAERLVQAQHTAAILTTFNEVDMSAVMALRARYKDSFEQRHGVKLSFMSFFARACVLALHQVPEINAAIRGNEIVYQRRVHLGVAVGTGRGLVVPVVRDADLRAFAEIEQSIARMARLARENRLTPAELSGGTFTISNGGVYGSLLSTPILNPPQSGILGMHKIEKRAVVIDDQIVIRPMMYLALSYDHRIVDGEQAVSFLVSVKERLEDPERMLLDV